MSGRLTAQIRASCGNFAGQSSSSGLHHDYHDNLYALLQVTPPITSTPCSRQGKSQLLLPAPTVLPLQQGKQSILGVMYRVLLWADMNAATSLGAWVCSVMSLCQAANAFGSSYRRA